MSTQALPKVPADAATVAVSEGESNRIQKLLRKDTVSSDQRLRHLSKTLTMLVSYCFRSHFLLSRSTSFTFF